VTFNYITDVYALMIMADSIIIPHHEFEHPPKCYYSPQTVGMYEFWIVEFITGEDVRLG
jgi:hypothetical protein